MSILNRQNDGLLSVLIALRRGILAYGPMPEADLLSLVAPLTIVPDGKADQARQTLRRWTQLGFFEERDAQVVLSTAAQIIPADDEDLFRAELLRLVLLPENNPKLLVDDPTDQEISRASDCTRAMAWALAQNPYAFPSSFESAELLQNRQGLQPRPFQNNTRWPGFLEWASFLGVLARGTKNSVIVNPRQAIKMVLPDVFAGSESMAQSDFLDRLANLIPVLDGGSYRIAVDNATPRPWRDRGERELSLTLSLGLHSLEVEGVLRLENRSDALSCRFLGRDGREWRSVTHLQYMGNGVA